MTKAHNRKLSDDLAYRVCTLIELGHSYKEICSLLNLDFKSYKIIFSRIINKGYYRDISAHFNLPMRKSKRFTKQEIENICKWISEGYSVRDIAHMIGYKTHSYNTIRSTVINIYNKVWFKKYSSNYVFPSKLITRGFMKLC